MCRFFSFVVFWCCFGWSTLVFADAQQCATVTATPTYAATSDKVNINTATEEVLSSQLKGIGKAKAAAIIEWRTTNGQFSSLDDLDEVKGIGAGIIEKNKDKIVFDD